jgi:hypothetical protein
MKQSIFPLFLVTNSFHCLSHSIPSGGGPIFKVNGDKSYMSKQEI